MNRTMIIFHRNVVRIKNNIWFFLFMDRSKNEDSLAFNNQEIFFRYFFHLIRTDLNPCSFER